MGETSNLAEIFAIKERVTYAMEGWESKIQDFKRVTEVLNDPSLLYITLVTRNETLKIKRRRIPGDVTGDELD